MSMLDLSRFTSPIIIQAIEVLRVPQLRHDLWFVRTRSADGAEGIAVNRDRLPYLWPMVQQLVIPCFVGQDARDLEALIERVYTYKSNYKLAGIPFWYSVAAVELSIWDMLGQIAGASVGQLLTAPSQTPRPEIPIYLSSLRRDTTPEQEVAWLTPRLEATAARAVKLKVGGRMSGNADAAPGRSEALIRLARQTWGDQVTLYVDANGSYDAAHAIETGRMLESYNVGWLEEPCPFDEYEQTRQVADALKMAVAGGEQDTAMSRLNWMIQHRAVDVIQADVVYNGGFIRTLRVAQMAAQAGIPVAPHCPRNDPHLAYMLHLASVAPLIAPHQEFRAESPQERWWSAPSFEARDGTIQTPTGPGLGIEYDPSLWRAARTI